MKFWCQLGFEKKRKGSRPKYRRNRSRPVRRSRALQADRSRGPFAAANGRLSPTRSSQGQRDIVALGKVFFDQPVQRQVGQDIAAIDDKNFIPNSMLNVFDPASRLQQVRLLEPAREGSRDIRSVGTRQKIFPPNGAR